MSSLKFSRLPWKKSPFLCFAFRYASLTTKKNLF
jgi:hypothetical protein